MTYCLSAPLLPIQPASLSTCLLASLAYMSACLFSNITCFHNENAEAVKTANQVRGDTRPPHNTSLDMWSGDTGDVYSLPSWAWGEDQGQGQGLIYSYTNRWHVWVVISLVYELMLLGRLYLVPCWPKYLKYVDRLVSWSILVDGFSMERFNLRVVQNEVWY